MLTTQIHPSWNRYLMPAFKTESMAKLGSFLENEYREKKEIYPNQKDIFTAFSSTPFDQVKVIIIGQDPYHGAGQAHGLSFSVQAGITPPPSLKNIYKELKSDIGFEAPEHGDLTAWAQQGVLLLNSVLTVEANQAGSHHGQGWEEFTDKVIEVLNNEQTNLVFLLWGKPAEKKAAKVDGNKHLVLTAPHPSPLSSYRGFFGCKHFSQTNDYLKEHGKTEIDWSL